MITVHANQLLGVISLRIDGRPAKNERERALINRAARKVAPSLRRGLPLVRLEAELNAEVRA